MLVKVFLIAGFYVMSDYYGFSKNLFHVYHIVNLLERRDRLIDGWMIDG